MQAAIFVTSLVSPREQEQQEQQEQQEFLSALPLYEHSSRGRPNKAWTSAYQELPKP